MPNPDTIGADQPLADLDERVAELLERARQTGEPVVLTQDGRDSGVLLDMAAYERLLDELDTWRDVHQALHDIAAGRMATHDQAKARILTRLP